MNLAALALAPVLVLAACGSSAPAAGRIGNQTHGPRPAAVVFIGAGDHRVMEVGCWDPTRGTIAGGDDCVAQVEAVVDGGAVVLGSDGARYRITGRLSDECEASGATMVAAIAPATLGVGVGRPALAVAPAEVDVDYRALPPVFDVDRKPTAPALGAELRAALAARATADLVGADSERTVEPAELRVLQVIDLDLDGDRAVDRLVSATVEGGGYAGYLWSGLVLLPGARADAAITLWHSDLEMLWIDGSFDLDGDGVRELAYSSEYYEGGGVGVARYSDGKLVFVGGYGCGA